MDHFEILEGYGESVRFLPDVQKAADAERNALGFLRRGVFDEFARRENLHVIIRRNPASEEYAGHLLFGLRFPRAQVVQMFTHPDYRKQGLATRLIRNLSESLTSKGFTSIYARVAEDLAGAQIFWERQQFYVQRIEQGGASRNRKIIVRCHELATPQLFPSSGINTNNPLGLINASVDVPPLFLIDLNVLFDLAPRRLRHDEAASLFQAERMNICRLAISDEIHAELKRTALKGKADPMENYISIFPSFPLLSIKDAKTLLNELACLVFPSINSAQLITNDISDLRHIATAIQHGLAGFITNDKKILDAAQKIRSKYSIEVVSPAAFILNGTASRSDGAYETSGTVPLKLQDVSTEDESALCGLLAKLDLSGSVIATGWLPRNERGRISRCCAVWSDGTLVGYAIWFASGPTGVVSIRAAVDEGHFEAFNAARILLRYSLDQLATGGPQQVRLELAPRQSCMRDLAAAFGFRGTPDKNCIVKILLGRVLTRDTWDAHQAELADKGGLKLPARIPTYSGLNQLIRVLTPDGNQRHVTLESLESLISPALLCLPGRPAVITPVKRGFAEPLLGHSKQLSLLPHGTASLYQDRHYLSSSRTLERFKQGSLMLFYESTKQGGRAAIVAIARVRQAYLKREEALDESDYEQSVLTPISIASIGNSKLKTVTVFDNIFKLPCPVSLASLKRIGCGHHNNLITTRPLTDEQLQQILKEAFALA